MKFGWQTVRLDSSDHCQRLKSLADRLVSKRTRGRVIFRSKYFILSSTRVRVTVVLKTYSPRTPAGDDERRRARIGEYQSQTLCTLFSINISFVMLFPVYRYVHAPTRGSSRVGFSTYTTVSRTLRRWLPSNAFVPIYVFNATVPTFRLNVLETTDHDLILRTKSRRPFSRFVVS